MNFSPSPKLEEFMASVATKLANGSRDLGFAPNPASHLPMPSTENMSLNGQADNQERTSTFGMTTKSPNYLTAWATHGPFTIQSNGSIGQTILDADGNTIAWTTDSLVAQVICRMMNEFTNNQ